jgi:hypothetical protein
VTLLAFENTVRHDFAEQRFTCTPQVAQRLAAYFNDEAHVEGYKQAVFESARADAINEMFEASVGAEYRKQSDSVLTEQIKFTACPPIEVTFDPGPYTHPEDDLNDLARDE